MEYPTGTVRAVLAGKTYAYPGTPDKDPIQRQWQSAFIKMPVTGPVQITDTGILGDKQADTKHHGGADQAILAYAASHYPAWQNELNNPLIRPGGFAENLTIDGSTEETVCIGDRYRIGEVTVEVSCVRIPCWKITRRWGIPGLTQRVHDSGRTGWYFRVLTPGTVEVEQTVTLLDRPHPDWTVLRAFRTYVDPSATPVERESLADCPALAERWRERLRGK